MFSLIITIVSIALAVALVAATMYHGGDTLTQGRERANAAAFVSGAQQITGAASMHLALEGVAPADVEALVTAGYLSSLPNAEFSMTDDVANGWVINGAGDQLTAGVASEAVCDRLAQMGGGGDTYGCAAGEFFFNY